MGLLVVGDQFPGRVTAGCQQSGCVRFLGGGFGEPGGHRLALARCGRFDDLLDLGGTEIESFRAVM